MNRPTQRFYQPRGSIRMPLLQYSHFDALPSRGYHFGAPPRRDNHNPRFRPYVSRKNRSNTSYPAGSLSKDEKISLVKAIRNNYNSEKKYLDLKNIVSKIGINANNRHRIFIEICRIIKIECKELESLDLSENNIKKLNVFRNLHNSAPDILNLNLSNNAIESLNELDHFKDYRHDLKELILSFNPMMEGADLLIYRHKVSKRFPRLKILDNMVVVPIIQFQAQHSSKFCNVPTMTYTSFYEQEQSQNLAQQFLVSYFELYDSPDRQGLLPFYSPSACFSFSLPIHTLVKNLTKKYANSRNLLKINLSSSSSSSRNLLKSPLNIVHKLNELPKTKHNLNSFCMDVFILPSHTTSNRQQVLNVTCKGIFMEIDTKTLRYFHRSFLLVPTHEKQKVQILNDQLFIYDVNPEAEMIGSSSVSPGNPQAPPSVPSPSPQKFESQSSMIETLCQQTSVSPAIAIQALTACNGNFQQAVQAINNHKTGN